MSSLHLLFVDDDAPWRDAVAGMLTDWQITTAGTVGDALRALEQAADLDLILCDLALPVTAGEEATVAAGKGLIAEIQRKHPGIPLLVVSGVGDFDDGDDIRPLLNRQDTTEWLPAEAKMVTGCGQVKKGDNAVLVERIGSIRSALYQLDAIPISAAKYGQSVDALSQHQRRALRIFAHRKCGPNASIRLDPMEGLSTSKTYLMTVEDERGQPDSIVVAKVDEIEAITQELHCYQEHVSTILPDRVFASVAESGTVLVGSGRFGAVFLNVVAPASPFFPLMVGDDAVKRIDTLLSGLENWTSIAKRERLSIGDVRRTWYVNDARLEDLRPELAGVDFAAVDEVCAAINLGRCHFDLHGGNALVSGDAYVLIDYGKVKGSAPTAQDAVFLELSLITHPSGREISGSYSADVADAPWMDMDAVAEQFENVAPSVRALREKAHALAGSEAAMWGIYYCNALRAMKWRGVPQQRLATVVREAAERLLAL